MASQKKADEMKKTPQKPKKSMIWIFGMIVAGFCLMLIMSLFAYRIESKYIRALETKNASLQGRIDELQKIQLMREVESSSAKK